MNVSHENIFLLSALQNYKAFDITRKRFEKPYSYTEKATSLVQYIEKVNNVLKYTLRMQKFYPHVISKGNTKFWCRKNVKVKC